MYLVFGNVFKCQNSHRYFVIYLNSNISVFVALATLQITKYTDHKTYKY